MQTKRYIGNDLARLYRRVRDEFGPDAMVFSTRTLHREDGPPLIEIQAGPGVDDDSLPLELQQAMLSTVLSRVGPGLKVPDLEDLVLRGVLGPSAVSDIDEGAIDFESPIDFEPRYEPEPRAEAPIREPEALAQPATAVVPGALTPSEQLVAAGLTVQAAGQVARAGGSNDPERTLASYLQQLPVEYPDEYETALVLVTGRTARDGQRHSCVWHSTVRKRGGRRLSSRRRHRAATAERLASYAEAMGVEFVEAKTDRALEKATQKAKSGSVIFVDADPGWLPPAFVRAPVYRYVALPSHWQEHALATWSGAVRHEPFAGAIPTFTDIATELTPVVSTLVALGTGIAFLSSGSDISNGIEVADAKAIASGISRCLRGGGPMGASLPARNDRERADGLAPGLALNIRYEASSGLQHIMTRVEEVFEDGLAVLVPMEKLQRRPLPSGREVEVHYTHRNRWLQFMTEVTGHSKDGHFDYLAMPRRVESSDRRRFFRLQTAIKPTCIFRIVVGEETEDGEADQAMLTGPSRT